MGPADHKRFFFIDPGHEDAFLAMTADRIPSYRRPPGEATRSKFGQQLYVASMVLLGREEDAVRIPRRDDEGRRSQPLGPGPGCSWLGRDDSERSTTGWGQVDHGGAVRVPVVFGGHGRSPPSLPEGGRHRKVLDPSDEVGLCPFGLAGDLDGVDRGQQPRQDRP